MFEPDIDKIKDTLKNSKQAKAIFKTKFGVIKRQIVKGILNKLVYEDLESEYDKEQIPLSVELRILEVYINEFIKLIICKESNFYVIYFFRKHVYESLEKI